MRHRLLPAVALLLASASTTASDPLAESIEHWRAFLQTPEASASNWKDVKAVADSVLPRAEDALRHGRRLLALYRFATVRSLLEAASYASRHPEKDFESEWKRSRPSMPPQRAFDAIAP